MSSALSDERAGETMSLSDDIVLSEYQSWHGSLSVEDRMFVLGALRRRFEVEDVGTTTKIAAKQYVGRVRLPSGRELRVTPKIPIASLFQMLGATIGWPPHRFDELIGCGDLDAALDLLATWFADLVDAQIARGLFRRYVDEETHGSFVRGRIDLARQLRAHEAERHQVHCQFSELTWNVPENQVIRQVLRIIPQHVSDVRLERRLRDLEYRLSDIDLAHFWPDDMDRFRYDRLNASYETIHRVCRVFLDAETITDTVGTTPSPGFLIDMNALFERFVTVELARRLTDVSLRSQLRFPLVHQPRVDGTLDIALMRGERLVLLADCKYKQQDDEAYHHADLYQVVTYCVAAGVDAGVLIYPQGQRAEPRVLGRTLKLANAEIAIHVVGVDISTAGQSLDAACDALAEYVQALVDRQSAEPMRERSFALS